MSNNAGIQNAREREKRVRGRFSTGRKKLSHHQIGYSKWRDVGMGAGREGGVAEAWAGRIWQQYAMAVFPLK